MANDLHKVLINYYQTLDKVYNKWIQVSLNTIKPLESLGNYFQQRQHVTSKQVDNAEICHINNSREKLIFKIHLGIEEEISHISNSIKTLNTLNEDLKNKLNHLHQVRSKINLNDPGLKDLINGTSFRPRLNLLLEWAIESQDFYQQIYVEMNYYFKLLPKNDDKHCDNLLKCFNKSCKQPDQVRKILSMTQFLINEKIK